eukprot:683801-Pyramimonas_sp.AAC.1
MRQMLDQSAPVSWLQRGSARDQRSSEGPETRRRRGTPGRCLTGPAPGRGPSGRSGPGGRAGPRRY